MTFTPLRISEYNTIKYIQDTLLHTEYRTGRLNKKTGI